MNLTEYTARRVFQSPYVNARESVSGAAVFGVLLLGPFYYWKKKAPVEALLLCVAEAVLFLVPDQSLGTGIWGIDYPSLVLWLGAAIAAPALLPICYRRKGWTEVS
jgi:hypothetical protein